MVFLVLLLLPQFLPPDSGHPLNAVALGVVQQIITVGWYSTLVYATGWARRFLPRSVMKTRTAQVSGLVFVTLGVRMIIFWRPDRIASPLWTISGSPPDRITKRRQETDPATGQERDRFTTCRVQQKPLSRSR